MRIVSDRRLFAFPPMEGTYDGIQLNEVDAADPDVRRLLINAQHAGEDLGPHHSNDLNLALHCALHEMVANQIWESDPPEVWETAQELLAIGLDRHDVMHAIMRVVSDRVYATLNDQDVSVDDYVAELRALASREYRKSDEAIARHQEFSSALTELLGGGPISYDEVINRLSKVLDPSPAIFADLEDELDYFLFDLGYATVIPDNQLVDARRVCEGMVLCHKLTPAEKKAGAVFVSPDFEPMIRLGQHDTYELASGGTAEFTFADEPGLEPLHGDGDTAVIRGPASWLDDIRPGHQLTITYNDGRFQVAEQGGADVAIGTAASALASACRSHGEPLELDVLIITAMLRNAERFHVPTAPLGVLVERAGLEIFRVWAAPRGTDWNAFLEHQGID